MLRLPPRSTRPDTHFPDTPRCRSIAACYGLPAMPPAAETARPVNAGPAIVAVVDDDPLFRETVSANLAEAGYRAAAFSGRSEEHTSELQSLMRISYAVFCLKKQKHTPNIKSVYSSSHQRIDK